MAGLKTIIKMYGRMQVQDVMWVWDYAKDEPRIEAEMTKEEIIASEKVKWACVKDQLDKLKASSRNDSF